MTWKQMQNGSWVSRDGYYVVNKVHGAWNAWFQMRGIGQHLGSSDMLGECRWMCRRFEHRGGKGRVRALVEASQ